MDFSILNEHFVLVVMVACLVVGYIIKHATFLTWIPNSDIPVVLAAVGAVLNAIVSNLSVESVVYGAVMGLASTGLHQGFKSFVEGKNTSGTEENKWWWNLPYQRLRLCGFVHSLHWYGAYGSLCRWWRHIKSQEAGTASRRIKRLWSNKKCCKIKEIEKNEKSIKK